jgi:DHA2 family multidrug resistance protein
MSDDKGSATSWKVYVGTCGVFLGAGIVSLHQRLLTIGLPDLRGVLGLGVDEAAWIPTTYDMALMFMGPFTIYLGGLLGVRRVLLWTGATFTVLSILMPFAPNLETLLLLQGLAGLASGTFYPLALSYALRSLPPRFTIYGIGAFSMELISSLSIATPLEAWYVEHWSWRWIFWTSAVLTPLLMLCVHLAIAPPPKPASPRVSWAGFLHFSLGLALIEGALEQGERLDWLGSGTIVAMSSAGAVLILAGVLRRWSSPNPLVSLAFLVKRNTLILGGGLFTLRFTLLSILVLIPGYLGVVQGYRPLQTGRVLLWLAVPALVMGVIAARLMKRIDGRLIATLALAGMAIACLMNAQLTTSWAADQFWWPQLVLAGGLAFLFVGQIGLVRQQALEAGALSNPIGAMTYAAFFQAIRLFGGQIGVSVMQHLLAVRTTFHASMLGRSVEAGSFLTDERLRTLAAGFAASSAGVEESQGRAAAELGSEVGRQASTLAYMDGFILVACVCAGMMVLYACMKRMKIYYDSKEMVAATQV